MEPVQHAISLPGEIVFSDDIKHQLISDLAKQVFSAYKGDTFIGVYNLKTHEVHLRRAIQARVWLEKDEAGQYVTGWFLDKTNKRILDSLPINQEIIDEYNKTQDIARICSIKNQINAITSHEVLLESINEQDHAEDYLGFSLVFNIDTTLSFVWSSGILNNRDEFMHRICDKLGNPKRLFGATPPTSYQEKIKKIVIDWLR